MKKAAILSAIVLSAICVTLGTNKVEKTEKIVSGFTAASQEKAETESIETKIDPMLPEIDTELFITPGMRIAVVSKATKGEFWSLVQKGMEAAVQDINSIYGLEKDQKITMTFEGSDTEEDVESQINILDAVIAENPDVICISASDMDSCQAQMEAAAENEIPIIAFDSNVTSTEHIETYCGSDNHKIGTMAAQKLAEALEHTGKIAIFSAQEKTSSIKDRVDGFCKKISEYEEMEIIDIIYQDQVEDIQEAMKIAIAENPDLQGIYCTNATVSDLYLGIEKPEEFSAIMVGVDATTTQQQAVKDGKELGIVSQHPYAIGYQAIYCAVVASNPENSSKAVENIFMEPAWIELSNIESAEYSNYIYEK